MELKFCAAVRLAQPVGCVRLPDASRRLPRDNTSVFVLVFFECPHIAVYLALISKPRCRFDVTACTQRLCRYLSLCLEVFFFSYNLPVHHQAWEVIEHLFFSWQNLLQEASWLIIIIAFY